MFTQSGKGTLRETLRCTLRETVHLEGHLDVHLDILYIWMDGGLHLQGYTYMFTWRDTLGGVHLDLYTWRHTLGGLFVHIDVFLRVINL